MNLKSMAGKIGMNYDSVLEDFCGDVSSIREKVESLLQECSIDDLVLAYSNGDEEGVRKAAHDIRKKAEKLGLQVLIKAALQLEEAKPGRLAAPYENLVKEFEKIKSVLSSNQEQ